MNISLVILASDQNSFLICCKRLNLSQQIKILFCNSSTESRLSFIQQNSQQWLLFIDADCEINAEILDILWAQVKSTSNNSIFAGLYQNPKNASYLQTAHNFIANRWVLSSFQNQKSQQKYFLGGAFLIYSHLNVFKNFTEDKFWGAEDKQLALMCQQTGYEVVLSESFKVIHHTSKAFTHFIKRAWLHGKNDAVYLNQKIEFINPTHYLIWLQKLEKSDWLLIPAVALHFLIQKVAKLTHSIRLMNS